jgi:sarcosine oxidase subunit beta
VREIARRAKARGVEFLLEEEVFEIPLEDGHVAGVTTNARTISSRVVVNAAGPHAAEIGRLVGVSIPITPLGRNLYLVGPAERVSGPYPMVIDFKHRFSFRHEPEGMLIGGGPPRESFNFRDHTEPDMDFFAKATPDFIYRIPRLEEGGLIRAWAGTDGYTRDGSGIIDRVESPEGFFCATGFCGHGVMQAPATGKVMAELIVDGHTSIDISGLGLKRFLPGGKLSTEGYVIAHLE